MSNIATLADQYAAIKMEIEKLEAQLKEVKKDIVATGRDIIEGDEFKVTVGLQQRESIAVAKAREVLDEATLAKLLKVSEFEVIRYKAIA
jgi:uncharacterized protein involved in exopolysaccharide biosynthesis